MKVLIIGMLLFLPTTALMHGDEVSLEKSVDGYLIDIGYSPEETVAGEQSQFDFNIVDESTGNDEPFTDIWFRISKENKTFLATGLHKASIGRTSLAYVFPESGEYEISVRFGNNGNVIAETTFPFEAGENGMGVGFSPFEVALIGLFGVAFGALLALFVRRS